MSRRLQTVELLTLSLDRDSASSLRSQLEQQIRRLILEGRLKQRTRMPPSRDLARSLRCSRNVVTSTFEQLKAEGFLTGLTGSGTFVAADVDPSLLTATRLRQKRAIKLKEAKLSSVGSALLKIKRSQTRLGQAFSLAGPDLKLFPSDTWARLSAKVWRHTPMEALHCSDVAGYLPLREAIAVYLHNARGISCSASQILITSGATQALDHMVRLLTEDGDAIWTENPCFRTGITVLTAARSRIVPVPVDRHGLSVEKAIELAPDARMAMITPSHQFPLGVVMSLKRRLELLEWASKTNAWILEDDYDSDFRYTGCLQPALQSLDNSGRVIYIGTFSKLLCESLRLGYVVLPPQLVGPLTGARGNLESIVPAAMQAVLARFIVEGHFAAHIHRMRRVYAARREMLLKCGKKYLQGLLEFSGHQTGLHVIASLTPAVARKMNDRQLAERACAKGIHLTPLSQYFIGEPTHSAVVLGYASVAEEQIEAAVRTLAGLLRS